MIRYLIFWAGTEWKFPPEVIRMDGKEIRMTGRIYKREEREKGPSWYVRSKEERTSFMTPNGAVTKSATGSQSQVPFICLKGRLIRAHSMPGLIITIKISLEAFFQHPLQSQIQQFNMGKEWTASLRERWKRELQKRMGEEGAVLSGILLGDKSALDPEVKELYQKNGIAHCLRFPGCMFLLSVF